MTVTAAAADTRTRILEATADCIASDGIAAVRMVRIAKAAGVSTALLHYHFATKERLFEEVLRHSYESSTVLDQESLRGAGRTPAQRLAAYLDRCLPSDDELARDWLLWQELALMCLRQPAIAAVSADLYQVDHERVAGIIRDGIVDGSFDDFDADAVGAQPQSRSATGSAPGCSPTTRAPPRRTPGASSRRPSVPSWRDPLPLRPGVGGSTPPKGHARGPPMTQTPRPFSRRDLLRAALGLGAGAALAGCGFSAGLRLRRGLDGVTDARGEGQVDGDLVYFNWADYLDRRRAGFQKEYGVRIIETNFDRTRG